MWLKPQGFAEIVSPDDDVVNLDGFQKDKVRAGAARYDTATCGHCNRVFHVGARKRPEDIGGLCKVCMRAICPNCLGTGRCEPFEAKIEREEERERVLRSYGLL